MKAVIAWWDLDGDDALASLRDSLKQEGVEAWAAVPGLVSKFWISDGSRWGAVMVFESEVAARQALPPNRAAELLGTPAPIRLTFDVEAFVTGPTGTGPTETGPTETGPTETGPAETGAEETGPRGAAPWL